jgi:CspA family cold shock protein
MIEAEAKHELNDIPYEDTAASPTAPPGRVASHALPRSSVKRFNSQRGYRAAEDVFVHISAIERAGLTSLNEGQHLEF